MDDEDNCVECGHSKWSHFIEELDDDSYVILECLVEGCDCGHFVMRLDGD